MKKAEIDRKNICNRKKSSRREIEITLLKTKSLLFTSGPCRQITNYLCI